LLTFHLRLPSTATAREIASLAHPVTTAIEQWVGHLANWRPHCGLTSLNSPSANRASSQAAGRP
jgi:hypothetical protein